MASKLREYLNNRKDIKSKLTTKQKFKFYTTGSLEKFKDFYKTNFNKKIKVKKIILN